MPQADLASLEQGLPRVRQAPKDDGTVELIARRPAENEREILEAAELDPAAGLVGDCWPVKRTPSTKDGSPNPERQLTLMSARSAALVAGPPERWPLAGDQLYVDLDLSGENLPPGTRLELGSAVIEITDLPHTGCGKFSRRFGVDAMKFVNSIEGRRLNLRGVNARIVNGGSVRTGDTIRKQAA
jgi:MOSC domain-containing protein YiiM